MFTLKEIERFWSKVTKSDGCWEFKSLEHSYRKRRYGRFETSLRGKKKRWGAHRVSFYLANGYMPKLPNMVCHHCDNPPCVRPSHLYAGTAKTNAQDMVSRGRQRKPGPKRPRNYESQVCFLYCSKGHYKAGNVVIKREKAAECRVCYNEERRLEYHKKKQRVKISPKNLLPQDEPS